MSRRKRYISKLTAEQVHDLELGYKQGHSHDFRLRCYCILLSAGGKSIPELTELLGVSNQAIYIWFNRWEAEGIAGLKTRPGRGRKRKLDIDNQEHVQTVKWALKKENRNLHQVRKELEAKYGHTLSDSTLRNFLKSLVTDTDASAFVSNPNKIQGRWLKS